MLDYNKVMTRQKVYESRCNGKIIIQIFPSSKVPGALSKLFYSFLRGEYKKERIYFDKKWFQNLVGKNFSIYKILRIQRQILILKIRSQEPLPLSHDSLNLGIQIHEKTPTCHFYKTDRLIRASSCSPNHNYYIRILNKLLTLHKCLQGNVFF